MTKLKIRAVKVIATTGQYIFLIPFLPFVGLHLLADCMLMFCAWSLYGQWSEQGVYTHGNFRRLFSWLLQKEDALDDWRSRSVASLKPSPISPDAESMSDST